MRIAFLWKWGSWKTTLSGAFANYLNEQWASTFYIDADINSHACDMVNVESSSVHRLSNNYQLILDYLYGNRQDIPKKYFLWITPPTKESQFVSFDNDAFLDKISIKNENWLRFSSIWGYNDEETWNICYHGKSEALVLLLNHLYEKKNEYVVVDSVTGIDNISNSLWFSYDLNILLVEPTKKSLQVYFDFIQWISLLSYKIPFKILLNKIEDDDDLAFLYSYIPKEDIIWTVSFSQNIKLFEQGWKTELSSFIRQHASLFSSLKWYLDGLNTDRIEYLKNIVDNYLNQVQTYYNSYYNIKLDTIFDTPFIP